jgi:anti-anti-sigma factor
MTEAHASPVFSITVDERDGASVLRLEGELDIAATEKLKRALKAAWSEPTRRVIVDLRGLRFMDSAGLGVLLGADIERRAEATPLAFIRGDPNVQCVFQLSRTEDRLTWVTDDAV